jgi:hypothetical protein
MMAMSVTADSLLSRPKLDYDVGYDTVVKDANVVVVGHDLDGIAHNITIGYGSRVNHTPN